MHWLIENTKAQFILCGSSARKLRIQTTNLLGGRAWQYHFYPFIYKEIPSFNLHKALRQGLIPNHYLSESKYIDDHFQAYVDVYLICEEHPKTKAMVVSQDKRPRQLKINEKLTISILPWEIFLNKLWNNEIL